MRMLNTFFKELTTQSNTAFSLGTRLIVFKGLKKKNHKLTIDFLTIVNVLVYLNTLRTLSDLIVLKFVPVEVPLKHKTVLI